jgi:predicted Rossmann fold nucleotide-binding protein DprA/Smf involved in DNA uptake
MTQDELERICRYFGNNCEIVCSFKKAVTEREGKEDSAETILNMINRRSLTLDDILSVTGLSLDETKNILKLMEKQGKIKSFYFADNIYYMPNIQ